MQYKSSPDRISITAGSINEESIKGPLPKIKEHIFLDQSKKPGWYDLPEDGLPRVRNIKAKNSLIPDGFHD